MSEQTNRAVMLEPHEVAAMMAHLEAALEHLEGLAHLCSIQEPASRAEEAVAAAMYMLRAAERRAAPHTASPCGGSTL